MSLYGILLIDKPIGMSSHTAVARVRRVLGTRKVGHAGTLDPAASGLLVVGVGAGTRLLTFLVGLDKTYAATIRLGVGTDTEDAEGAIVTAPGVLPETDRVAIERVLAGFVGTFGQRPSSVSAIKVDGERAYRRQRRGESVELPERQVTISSIDLARLVATRADGVPVIDIEITCRVSSGTYIRALARDVGERLGTAGHLTALRRTSVGPFALKDAVDLEELSADAETMSLGAVARLVLPAVVLDETETRAVGYGQRIPARDPAEPQTALLDPSGGLVAVAGRGDDGAWRYLMVVPTDARPARAVE